MHFYQKNIGDFNNATRHLTRVERSLFSDAIELYYDTEKPLTNDINKLNRLLLAHSQEEKDALLVVLAEFFTLTDEGYFNKRCNEEIVKYQAYMESKSKAGKASAEQRAKQKATGVEQVLNTTPTKQNQEPLTINQEQVIKTTPKPKRKKSALEYEDHPEFLEFWNLYPRGDDKRGALEAWVAVNPPIQKVLQALEWQLPIYALSDIKFVPMPTTYINKSRWEDEPPKQVNGVPF
jgi:uncharacterized protein YdaU (DUF1376 family)